MNVVITTTPECFNINFGNYAGTKDHLFGINEICISKEEVVIQRHSSKNFVKVILEHIGSYVFTDPTTQANETLDTTNVLTVDFVDAVEPVSVQDLYDLLKTAKG